ncbi:hypothetical protein Pth03_04350 [Planotetraspora thailandica]|uniref:Uncharacterized protein n=1 Tax=Planotetraspora thailandica TaxID=487172 RepID=A0A8J3UWD7_9ACTN|nr:hypothetical protein [Planotetraspora thailandica]GII52046.1 hypothetical protein Pth03_04350 [Planotetraspora thailandica]
MGRNTSGTCHNPADLINVALEELLESGRELPGYTTLDRMVAKIRAEVNRDVFATVADRITPGQRARLEELLVVDSSSRRSRFDRLKDPAKAATIGKFKVRLAHLADLDALGPTDAWLRVQENVRDLARPPPVREVSPARRSCHQPSGGDS